MGETDKRTQEIQILEQNLQNLLYQKQAFQMELSETEAAKKEIEGSDEVFKIIGQLMIKTDKEKVKEENKKKEKLLNMRIQSIEKQETAIAEKLESLRKDGSKKNN